MHNKLFFTHGHFKFLIEGQILVKKECETLNIPFNLLNKFPENLAKLATKYGIGSMVYAFYPSICFKNIIETVLNLIPKHISVIQVDARNIVNRKEDLEYLVGFPKVYNNKYMKN